jgi:hypothetical protein
VRDEIVIDDAFADREPHRVTIVAMRFGHRGPVAAFIAMSFAAAAVGIACSSFDSGNDNTGDGGTSDAAVDALVASDSTISDVQPGDVAALRFCDQYRATALICDDFEENGGGIIVDWMRTQMHGTISAVDAPDRPGHAVKMTANTDDAAVLLTFTFAAKDAIAGVVFDIDMRVDTGDYNYMELVEIETATAGDVYFGGIAKGGNRFGMQFTPFGGPFVPFDSKWHHVHIELVNHVGPDAGGDAGALTQTVMMDSTVIENTTADISHADVATVRFGVIKGTAAPGQPDAVVYFDNVLLRATKP